MLWFHTNDTGKELVCIGKLTLVKINVIYLYYYKQETFNKVVVE